MKVTAEQLTLRALWELLAERDEAIWLRDVIAERLQEADHERETEIAPEEANAVGWTAGEVFRYARDVWARLLQIAATYADTDETLMHTAERNLRHATNQVLDRPAVAPAVSERRRRIVDLIAWAFVFARCSWDL